MKIEEKIRYGQQKILQKSLFPRKLPDIDLLGIKKIVSFLGGRRTGKTSLMIQLIQRYLKTKLITIDQVIHIDFSELDNHRIDLSELYSQNKDKNPIFLLDEVQELQDFEKQLVFLFNMGCRIFISGSNSKLLGQDISTKLRGRVFEIHNDVLDFEEYLIFVGKQELKAGIEMDICFDEYLARGGYPEIVLQQSAQAKLGIIQSYLDVIIYKDLIDRYNIKNQDILYSLIRSLTKSNTKQINLNKLFNTYKSLGYSLSKNTLYEYMQYLKNNFFISTISNIQKKSYFDKAYLIDNAYMNLFDSQANLGQKFENTCYKALKKKQSQLGYKDTPYDVDLAIYDTNRQVCYEINEENYERETKFGKYNEANYLITRSKTNFPMNNITQLRYDEFL